jgi:flagellar protein FlaF
MAVADLIGATVGVILLVIVAYMLVGSVISTAEIVINAQKSVTLQEESQLRTDFTIGEVSVEPDSQISFTDINCSITNTGKETISDFTHTDIIVYDNSSNNYQLYTYNKSGNPGTWQITYMPPDGIHYSELDPGETYQILVRTSGISPHWFQITTGNGVYASEFL